MTSAGVRYQGVVVGADENRDLALLVVPSLQAPPLRAAQTVAVGDSVIAVGYAAGLPLSPAWAGFAATKPLTRARNASPSARW